MQEPGADLRCLRGRFLFGYMDRKHLKHLCRDGNDDHQVESKTGHFNNPLPHVFDLDSPNKEDILYM